MTDRTNPFEIAQEQLAQAAEVMGSDETTHEFLRWPMREFHVHFPVKMDDGTTHIFEGLRVRYNDAPGPTKGALRFHPQQTFDTVRALVRALAALFERDPQQSVLDVQVVDDQDVSNGTSYGTLFHAIHHRPLQVWER